jgi:hypothetical protein
MWRGPTTTAPFFLIISLGHRILAGMKISCIKNMITALVLCLLCSCSNTRLAYNYLDWIITWYLNDYLSLNSRQEDVYEQRLKALLQWHRRDQLVLYSRFAGQLQQDMRRPLTPALLQERSDSLKQFWHTIMEQAAPDCAGLLLMLDPHQRKALFAALNNKQKELEDIYLCETAARRKDRQYEQAEKPLKRFVGTFTGSQKELIESWAAKLVPLQSLWLENRRTWQKSLQAVLDGDEPEEKKRKLLERLFIEPEYLWTQEYRHAIELNEKSTLAMLVDLLGTLTEKQQQHMQATLETLKEDFISLSKE